MERRPTEIPRPRLRLVEFSFLLLVVPFVSPPSGGVVPPASGQLLYLLLVVVGAIWRFQAADVNELL